MLFFAPLLLLACPAPEPPVTPEVEVQAPQVPVEPAPLPEPTEARYSATHVLITWQGAVRARPGITRTEQAAHSLAEELHQRASAGEPLEELAITYSDGPSAPRGGRLGVYATGTMVPDFERAVASVEAGQLAPLTRTPFGWHVIQRDPIEEVRISHVLVSWQGALRSASNRTQAEALQVAEQIQARLVAGEGFDAVATELSDDSSRLSGGDLGIIAHGQMVPDFEDAAFSLDVGQRSAVVETPYGYHILLRTE